MGIKDEYAYPQTSPVPVGEEGLTKREYFAGLALQGLLSDPSKNITNVPIKDLRRSIARASVLYSDALIAELNKNT